MICEGFLADLSKDPIRESEKELLMPEPLHIPIGLKYLREIELNFEVLYSSSRSCSHSNFVFAYIDFGEGLIELIKDCEENK